MANPQHLQFLDRGAEAFNRWRDRRPSEPCDLSDVDFSGRDLRGFNLTEVNLAGANLDGADLQDVLLRQANLQLATLRKANLGRAQLRLAILLNASLVEADAAGADFEGAALENATLDGANLEKAKLSTARLEGALLRRTNLRDAVLANANLSNADLTGANASGAHFSSGTLISANFTDASVASAHFNGAKAESIRLQRADLQGTSFADATLTRATLADSNCARANFQRAHLNEATIAGADFLEADFSEATLVRLKGAGSAKHLDTTKLRHDARYFETCERGWTERWLSWEVIRTIGNLKLFAVSYSLLAFLLTTFYVVGLYNEKVMVARRWARGVEVPDGRPTRLLAGEILQHVHPFLFSWDTVLLFGATIVLVIASIIYTFGCPAEIKDFTEPQWRYQLGRSLVHYWSLAWRGRGWRLVCGTLYLVGGLGFVPIIGYKLVMAFVNVWKYGNISPLG
ncbi:MAG: pentapeptide repeat-containing protein [Pirellulales bacterium]|nr:pentapeptide repeat-containing protein [Pirellulales bacterium]